MTHSSNHPLLDWRKWLAMSLSESDVTKTLKDGGKDVLRAGMEVDGEAMKPLNTKKLRLAASEQPCLWDLCLHNVNWSSASQ